MDQSSLSSVFNEAKNLTKPTKIVIADDVVGDCRMGYFFVFPSHSVRYLGER